MHNIVSESHRVARTYVGIFDWLVSYAVYELSFDGPNMTNSSGRMVKPESGIRNPEPEPETEPEPELKLRPG